jgi:hypothetical protein
VMDTDVSWYRAGNQFEPLAAFQVRTKIASMFRPSTQSVGMDDKVEA